MKLVTERHFLRFGPQETIFPQGVPVAALYVVCHGLVKLVFSGPSGKRLLIRFCGPGELLEVALSEEHLVSSVAVDEAAITFLPKELALGLLNRQPELAVEVARRLSQDRQMLLGRLAYFAYGSVRRRLARGLWELGTRYGLRGKEGLRMEVPLTQRDLADLVGASRQTVCQELQELEKKGLIRLEAQRITIADPEALCRLG
ncbi:MAG: Crp/Fnr family transcriptional regulator [Candidatus Bipolaricaulaceae bacterium]